MGFMKRAPSPHSKKKKNLQQIKTNRTQAHVCNPSIGMLKQEALQEFELSYTVRSRISLRNTIKVPQQLRPPLRTPPVPKSSSPAPASGPPSSEG